VVHPLAERRFLEQIAQLSGKPELSYAPDEDIDLDPTANVGTTATMCCVTHSRSWTMLAPWDRLNKRYPTKGESYSELSELFNKVFFHYLQNTYFITKYIGGQSFYRSYATVTGNCHLKRYLWRNNGRLWQRCSISCGCFKFQNC